MLMLALVLRYVHESLRCLFVKCSASPALKFRFSAVVFVLKVKRTNGWTCFLSLVNRGLIG